MRLLKIAGAIGVAAVVLTSSVPAFAQGYGGYGYGGPYRHPFGFHGGPYRHHGFYGGPFRHPYGYGYGFHRHFHHGYGYGRY